MVRKAQTAAAKIRLYLLDDEPTVLRGLKLFLRHQPDLNVCGSARESRQAMQQIPSLKPDVAVVDLSLREGHSLELIGELRQLCPDLKILVFSMHNQAGVVKAALQAGADGFVAKGDGAERVLEAIRLVLAGRSYLSPTLDTARKHG